MISSECVRAVHFDPLTGLFDARSLPGNVDPGSWRWLQNLTITANGKLCRSPGWAKLFSQAPYISQVPYNNQDLHDQLLGQLTYQAQTDLAVDPETIQKFPHAACAAVNPSPLKVEARQPVTFLFESHSTSGARILLAGTQTRLYALNESRGNWKLLTYGAGGAEEPPCSKTRWHGAQAGDYLILTNNVDPPSYWPFDGPSFGCDQKALHIIPDLAIIGLTRAGVVATWKGIVFFGDVEMDGLRYGHRVLWSDRNNAISYDPARLESIAAYQDLDYGERILAMLPLANNLLIYTTKGIWRVAVVGGEAIFSFEKIYDEPTSGKGCLAYRNTLVSDGDNHYYLGTDALYRFNMYLSRPEPVEWMHLATSVIYDDINGQACDSHVASYNSQIEEMWISWARVGETCPSKTLRFNLRYKKSFYLDHGFTAFANYSSDRHDSIGEFMIRHRICDAADIEVDLVKEPPFPNCPVQPVGVAPGAGGVPTSIHTVNRLTIDDITQEDYTLEQSDPGSLCGLMGGLTFDDICLPCYSDKRFVMASAGNPSETVRDYSLKEYGGVYLRERCTGFTGCGTYASDGYTTRAIKGPLSFGAVKEDKQVESAEVEYEAEEVSLPSELVLSIGVAAQAIDPSPQKAKAGCAIMWDIQTLNKRYLKCLESKSANGKTSAEVHLVDHTRPNLTLDWPLWYVGRFIYIELSISGVGGVACFSRLTLHAKKSDSCLSS